MKGSFPVNSKKLSLSSNLLSLAAATALAVMTTQGALAQKKYDTGASDTEIKIGNVEAYSGPASAYGIRTLPRSNSSR
jgi:branched-chain amino acid transport system substrate-binding protein